MANRRLRHAISDAWNRGGNGLVSVIVPVLRELIRLWNDGTLRVEVAGTEVGTRSTENFVAGSGITISGSDDSTNERVDVTIASSVTQYTDEMAQDAVGGMLIDGSTIDFTYTDATPAITAEVAVGSITTSHIKDGTITPADMNNGTALSVLGRSANSSGVRADIAATASSGQVLRESGSTVGWGTIATAGIGDAQVTEAKLSNGGALSLLGRSANSSGVRADISATASTFGSPHERGSAIVWQKYAFQTLTVTSDAASLDVANGLNAKFTNTAAGVQIDFVVTNLVNGMEGTIICTNHVTDVCAIPDFLLDGGTTNTVFIEATAAAAAYDSSSSKVSVWRWVYDGTRLVYWFNGSTD